MKENFDKCFSWLMEHEGGFCDDTALGDSGGMTCWGVTHADWTKWQGHPATRAEMKGLTQEDVKPLYKKFYWNVVRGDDLPSGVDYAIFDYGVNSGVYRAVKVVQRLVGVTQDGVLGPKTYAAVLDMNAKDLVHLICAERLGFLRRLKIFRNFGRGWTRRVNEVEARAKGMAS